MFVEKMQWHFYSMTFVCMGHQSVVSGLLFVGVYWPLLMGAVFCVLSSFNAFVESATLGSFMFLLFQNKIKSVTALRIVLDIIMFLTYCCLKFNRRISSKGCSVVSVAPKSFMASLFPVYSLKF